MFFMDFFWCFGFFVVVFFVFFCIFFCIFFYFNFGFFLYFFFWIFGFLFDYFGFLFWVFLYSFFKLIGLLLKVTKVTTGHQKWPTMGQNSIKSSFFARRIKKNLTQEQEVGPRSGPYHLVLEEEKKQTYYVC